MFQKKNVSSTHSLHMYIVSVTLHVSVMCYFLLPHGLAQKVVHSQVISLITVSLKVHNREKCKKYKLSASLHRFYYLNIYCTEQCIVVIINFVVYAY